MTSPADIRYMSAAIALARTQLGRTAPNPAVGCILVKSGRVLATGRTADRGRPHAERVALDAADEPVSGATAYVSLEPCAHYGQTPPCAEALVDARIARVVIACQDEDPRVKGRGVEILRDAGIPVTTGVCAHDAAPLYAGFFHRVKTGRPLVYVTATETGFDGRLEDIDLARLDAELTRLGDAGLSRIRLSPDHPAAAELVATGRAVRM